MPTIVLTNNYKGVRLEIAQKVLPPGFNLLVPEKAEKGELLELVDEADYLLVSGRLKIDADILKSASSLKMVQRTGVGLDTLDLEALRLKGVPLYVNRGVNAASVAEHAILLMLACLRRLPLIDSGLKSGQMLKQASGIESFELRGKTVGLIGLGSIGRETALRLKAFGTSLIYYDAFRLNEEAEAGLGIKYLDLDEVFKTADIVSLHCPLNDETRFLVNAQRLDIMKQGSILINTARGGLVDEKALAQSLLNGHLAFAGLDVFATEPLPQDDPLRALTNVILTPHIAGVTYDAFYSMMDEAMANILLFEQGKAAEIENKRVQ